MGLFDRLKQKVTQFTEKVSEKVTDTVTSVTESVSSVTESVGEVLSFDRLKQGLSKTRASFVNRLTELLLPGRQIDAALLNEIEELMLSADIGVRTTTAIIESVRTHVRRDGLKSADQLYDLIKQEINTILVKSPTAQADAEFSVEHYAKPHVIMIVGVNGVGKTTSIGKLARNYKSNGYEVLIGAADTFRAAANDQLEIWAGRAGVDIVMQKQGADPAAVAFDTVKAAQARGVDVVLVDTAGRLHNKTGLMSELEKISRVMKKLKSTAPDEVFLVLDATTGQNAINQAKEFMKVSPITGLILTKLDGTAKGGVVIAIANELKIPVRYIGVGEKIDDLQPFDPQAFVDALFSTQVQELETMFSHE